MKKRIILALIIGTILAGLSLFHETASTPPGDINSGPIEGGICVASQGDIADACSPIANLIKHRGFPFPLTTYAPAYAPISNGTKAINVAYMLLDIIFYTAIAYLFILLSKSMNLSSKPKRPAKR